MLFKSIKKPFEKATTEIDRHGWSPLHMAAQGGLTNSVIALIGRGADIEARDSYKHRTPLHWAADADTKTALALITRGADIHATDIGGETPLHIAMRTGRGETARTLLHHGAELDARDFRGHTPLHAAVSYGGPAIEEKMREIVSLHYSNRAKAIRTRRQKHKRPMPGA